VPAQTTTVIEIDEIQGNVLYAYGECFSYARYVLLRITNAASARERVRWWVEEVTFGRRPQDLPPAVDARPHVNIAFTFPGLRSLGVPDDLLFTFPEEFRQGPRERAEDNGDVGDSSAEHWIEGLGTGHILLVVHAHDEEGRDRLVADLLKGIDASMTVLHDLSAARLKTRRAPGRVQAETAQSGQAICNIALDREHFGFSDGCSQPAIEGLHDDPTGGGVYVRTPLTGWQPVWSFELLLEDLGLKSVRKHWRSIRPGEFVLGYDNEDGVLPTGPPDPLGPNGTFMVYRPMSQDVPTFDTYVADEAQRLELDPELVRAKIVGRWPDGTPLTLCPERRDVLIATDRRRANDFLYQEAGNGYPADTDGYGCPLGAHVRRANPRDALPGGGERTMRHRIIRRGMPYGERDGTGDRGLVFVCFNASIANGFEFILRTWCNDGAALGLAERDLLLQQGDPEKFTGMVIQFPDNRTVVLKPPPKPFVTVRGCEYLFVPSRRACQWLANLR